MTDRWRDAIATAEGALRGDHEARERVAAVACELSGDPALLRHADIARNAAYLSSLLEALGLTAEARALLEQLVSRLLWDPVALSLPGEVRNDLAVALADRGHLPAAVALLSTAVALGTQDVAGHKLDPAEARFAANLAALKLRLGDGTGARSAAERVRLSLPALDDASREQIEIRLLTESVLAEVARREGDDRAADELVRAIARTARQLVRNLGGEHPASLSALITLTRAEFASALAAGNQERLERLVDVLAISAQKASVMLGRGHPLSHSAMVNFAAAERDAARAAGDQRRLEEAQAMLQAESGFGASQAAPSDVRVPSDGVKDDSRKESAARARRKVGVRRSGGGGRDGASGYVTGSLATAPRPHEPRLRRKAGIRDVAAAAGVSITTVSDALNGKGRLPDATRRHVREVADRLGYRPSAAARVLRTGRSDLIGLTVTTYGDEPFTFTEVAYFAEMARAATSAALARGYALVTLPATSRHDVWSNVALDGTVVINPFDHDPVVTELVRQGLPVVSVGRPAGALPATAWVEHDYEAAVLDLLDHLAAAGARRIGLLTGTTTDTYTRLSTTAYLKWCERVGQDPVYESYPAHDPCAGAVAADRLLARPDRPDAVYGLFDPNGTDLLAAARRYGLRVPEDLLLVCCSESTVYANTEPPITTLSLKPRRIGTAVVQLLIDAIEGIDEGRPVEQVMPTELIVRKSSQRRGAGGAQGG